MFWCSTKISRTTNTPSFSNTMMYFLIICISTFAISKKTEDAVEVWLEGEKKCRMKNLSDMNLVQKAKQSIGSGLKKTK